ncbi:MAG TPA: radical SAM family heme chaperone HemW [Rudaea sp.]|jgi:oxygen-independent coproporphyrinogen-3 oxidase|nr:radical SAM family heme chaperone HemW [Rudaea sp.]
MLAPESIPLSLYIHIPWCVRKCPYCDFNSHNAPEKIPQTEYADALMRDLDRDLPLAQGRMLRSIFFGGGTPSLLTPDTIAKILDGVATRLRFSDTVEITLETNPGTVEHGPFAGYRNAGVNRISFGVQSFDDDALKRIGRIHSAGEAERAVKMAQDAGIDNINLDLMYALPEQTIDGALADMEKAISLQTPHLSHYQLTLEPNTQFAANPPPLPDDDSAWDMQEACQARLAASGLHQYEVSAYARSDNQCRHNMNYWAFGDYLGIGAGAHGKLTQADGEIHRRWKVRAPRGFLELAGTRRGIGGDDAIPVERLPFEFMLNALRLNLGFEMSEFEARSGLSRNVLAPTLSEAQARGLIDIAGDRVRASDLGFRFLNDTIALFLPNASRRSAA